MQNLATANLVDLMLSMRVPMDRLIDWIDQAYLYLHVRKKETVQEADGTNGPTKREILRKFGIRTATDLQDTCDPNSNINPFDQKRLTDLSDRIRQALDPEVVSPSASTVDAVLAALANEPNLFHVKEWKTFPTDLLNQGK